MDTLAVRAGVGTAMNDRSGSSQQTQQQAYYFHGGDSLRVGTSGRSRAHSRGSMLPNPAPPPSGGLPALPDSAGGYMSNSMARESSSQSTRSTTEERGGPAGLGISTAAAGSYNTGLRPSGATYARSSPIGPPPQSALPNLPGAPSSSSSTTSQDTAAQRYRASVVPNGMGQTSPVEASRSVNARVNAVLGMASSRPTTALWEGGVAMPEMNGVGPAQESGHSQYQPTSTSSAGASKHPFAYPSPDPSEHSPPESRYSTAKSTASMQPGRFQRKGGVSSPPETTAGRQAFQHGHAYSIDGAQSPMFAGAGSSRKQETGSGHKYSNSTATTGSSVNSHGSSGNLYAHPQSELPQAPSNASSPVVPTRQHHSSARSSRRAEPSTTSGRERAQSTYGANGIEMDRESSTGSTIQGRTARGASDAPSSAGGIGDSLNLPSKSVLTIALQKAQSAVLLDSAQNEEAAILAYMQSVRLLKEVMARVEESAGSWRAKELEKLRVLRTKRRERARQRRMILSEYAGREEQEAADEDEETEEERKEREKREAKLEKREKMRMDESRRLKVIHDTYEERIRILTSDLQIRERAEAASQETKIRSEAEEQARLAAFTATATSPTLSNRAQVAPTSPSGTAATIAANIKRATSLKRRSKDSTDSAGATGIGSAMLGNLPVSPRSLPPSPPRTTAIPFPAPGASSEGSKRRSGSASATPPSLPLPETMTPLKMDEMLPSFISMNPSASDKEIAAAQYAALKKAGPNEQSSISFSPDSESSRFSSSARDRQISQGGSSASGYSPTVSSNLVPADAGHRRMTSASSLRTRSPAMPTPIDESEEPSVYGTNGVPEHEEERLAAPYSTNAADSVDSQEDQHVSALATPTPDTGSYLAFSPASESSSAGLASLHQVAGQFPQQPQIPSQQQQSRSRKSSAAAEFAAARSRAGSQSSSAYNPSLRNMTSNESLSSNASSSMFSQGGGSGWANAAENLPLPPMPSASQQQQLLQNAQSRQARSASLIGQMMAPSSSTTAQSSGDAKRNLLVNPSTAQGTISQRRGKSPNLSNLSEATMSAQGDSSELSPPLSSAGSGRTASKEQEPSSRASRSASVLGSNPNATSGPSYNVSGSVPMRIRALSQPGKRPGLQSYHSDYAQPPSMPLPPLPGSSTYSHLAAPPLMQRSDSDPTSKQQSSQLDGIQQTSEGLSPPSPTADLPTHDGRSYAQAKQASSSSQDAAETSTIGGSRSFIEPETPTSSVFLRPDIASSSQSVPSAPSTEYIAPPKSTLRKPFHFMLQIRTSIQAGGYLTPRLYIPKQMWAQVGVKLLHVETKVRMLDLLLSGLEGIERTGQSLLLGSPNTRQSSQDAASRLMRELEAFEGMLDGVQSTLAKKLGYIEAVGGKKGGQSSFGAWSSKLSRSMDKMTKGKNLDSPDTYVAAIARLCLHAQIIDRHLASIQAELPGSPAPPTSNGTFPRPSMQTSNSSSSTLHPLKSANDGPSSPAYAELGLETRRQIESRLRRSSDFFGSVICQVILNDLGAWLDKYNKKAALWTVD